MTATIHSCTSLLPTPQATFYAAFTPLCAALADDPVARRSTNLLQRVYNHGGRLPPNDKAAVNAIVITALERAGTPPRLTDAAGGDRDAEDDPLVRAFAGVITADERDAAGLRFSLAAAGLALVAGGPGAGTGRDPFAPANAAAGSDDMGTGPVHPQAPGGVAAPPSYGPLSEPEVCVRARACVCVCCPFLAPFLGKLANCTITLCVLRVVSFACIPHSATHKLSHPHTYTITHCFASEPGAKAEGST